MAGSRQRWQRMTRHADLLDRECPISGFAVRIMTRPAPKFSATCPRTHAVRELFHLADRFQCLPLSFGHIYRNHLGKVLPGLKVFELFSRIQDPCFSQQVTLHANTVSSRALQLLQGLRCSSRWDAGRVRRLGHDSDRSRWRLSARRSGRPSVSVNFALSAWQKRHFASTGLSKSNSGLFANAGAMFQPASEYHPPGD